MTDYFRLLRLLFYFCRYSDTGNVFQVFWSCKEVTYSNNHVWVNKHHTVQDSTTSVLALGFQRPITAINVRGMYVANFSDWGWGGWDTNKILAQWTLKKISERLVLMYLGSKWLLLQFIFYPPNILLDDPFDYSAQPLLSLSAPAATTPWLSAPWFPITASSAPCISGLLHTLYSTFQKVDVIYEQSLPNIAKNVKIFPPFPGLQIWQEFKLHY